MFEGVRAIGKINLAYSIAVYVWKYYKDIVNDKNNFI